MENEKNNNQLQIELKEEVAQGTYANLAIITHSSSEFIVDFVRVMPGLPKAGVQSRIVLTPEHAKRLMYALQENVAKYERNFWTYSNAGRNEWGEIMDRMEKHSFLL